MPESERGRLSAGLVPALEERKASIKSPAAPIAGQLPSLVVFDITPEVTRAITAAEASNGIAFVSAPAGRWVTRIDELETGALFDFESLLTQLVAPNTAERDRVLCLLLGGRSEAVPFQERRLCLGPRQRILLIGLGKPSRCDWLLTVIGC
jgi:thiamine phosphate synthase YjbQ (UPF0047 family)